MNRFKLNILVLGAACLGLASCSESYLDTEPITSATTGNFYKTQNDAARALIGCYDGWQCTNSNGGFAFYVASQVMSDECLGATGYADDKKYQIVDRFDQTQASAEVNIFDATWKDYYAAIYRCNSLIKYENQITWSDETIKGTYLGECKTIRALCYFDMVRLWGNIPLLKEPTTDNVPQSPADSVYALIVSDLKYAINNIPANAYPKANSATNDGRITKYAAEALLARVYLYYTGYYGKELKDVTKAEVLAGLEDIISSNEFGLVDEFKNLWPAASTVLTANKTGDETVYGVDKDKTTYAGDGNKETILALKFNTTHDYNGNSDGNRWLVMMGMRNLNWSPYGKGWGACTVNPKIWTNYGSGDNRRESSIINLAAEGIEKSDDFSNSVKDWREYTGYNVKKYTPMAFPDGASASKLDGSGDFQISQHQDLILIRYADVLLMAAELGSANADLYLNLVRKRAFQSTDKDGKLVISSEYKEISASKENILNERKLEFAFEGIRYWDLLRQGLDFAASQIAESGIKTLSGNTEDIVTISAQNIIAKKGLMQIPQNQISLANGKLIQNAGWQ